MRATFSVPRFLWLAPCRPILKRLASERIRRSHSYRKVRGSSPRGTTFEMLVMLSPLIYSDQQLLRRWTRQPPRGTTFEMLVMLSPLIYSDQQLLRRWTRQPVWCLSDAEVSSRSARSGAGRQ